MPRHAVAQVEGLHVPRSYSHLVVSDGPLVHVAGQVALDTEGRNVGVGDFGLQAAQAFSNLATALAGAGSNPSLLVSLTIYITASVPRSELTTLQSVPALHLSSEPPAITLLYVDSLLDPDWLIEVQAVAVLRDPYNPRAKIMLELEA